MKLLKVFAKEGKSFISIAIIPIVFTIAVSMLLGKIFIENIPFGIADLDNSSMSRTIVQQFKDHPGLKVNYYAASQDELDEAIKTKKISAGIIIPRDFNKDVVELKAPKTILLVDETNMVIGNNALSYCSAILNTLNTKVQLTVLEANNMFPYVAQQSINALSFAERMLYDPQMSYMRYLIYAMVIICVQQMYLVTLVPILIEEKKNMCKMKIRSKEGVKKISFLALRIFIFILLAYIGTSASLLIAGKYFDIPIRANLLEYITLVGIFFIDITAAAFVFSFIFNSSVHFVEFIMCMSPPMILTCGYTWPEYMMPSGFAQGVKAIWPMIYVSNPLRTINLKGSDWSYVLPYINGGIKYALVWLPIGIGLYTIKIVIGKSKNKKQLMILENKGQPTCAK